MKIKQVTMYHVQLPMIFEFKTAKGKFNSRDTIIIKTEDYSGLTGFGEVVSFISPFYTEETLDFSWEKLKTDYIPKILKSSLSHPFEIHQLFENPLPMALSGLENSLLDLYFKEKNSNIILGLFSEKLSQTIPRGAVLGQLTTKQILKEIDILVKKGVKRVKLKISPEQGIDVVRIAITTYPQIDFAVDANRSFSMKDWSDIVALDQLGLVCIEEPFKIETIGELAQALALQGNDFSRVSSNDDARFSQSILKTPICFDESVQSLDDLQLLPELPLKTMLNIKIGRLGGLYHTQKAIEFCRNNQIGFWIGSMVESGISKILHVQLAALSGNVMAGDLSDSQYYFEEDLIIPEIVFSEGFMTVPTGDGIGVGINEGALNRATIRKEIFQ